MGRDQLSPAKDTVASLVDAANAFRNAPPGSPSRAEPFERLVKQAEVYGERWGDLALDVEGGTLSIPDGVVHDDAESAGQEPFAAALSECGIRRLTLGTGVAREEIETLVNVLSRAGRGDEDVPSALWRAQLWAVTVDAQDDDGPRDSEAAARTRAFLDRFHELRERARAPGPGVLSASPPVGRDLVPEAPPPEPAAGEQAKTQALPPADGLKRALEVTRSALWRQGATLPPELGGKLFHEIARRALEKQDLQLAADILDRADPAEAPAPALAAGERLAQLSSQEIVRAVPHLYAQVAEAQGEEIALSLALRVLGHLDSQGVLAAANGYADLPSNARRPFRRLLSARGGEALDAVIRLADHQAFDVAKDGLAILAVIPAEAARKALEKFAKDPTTPRDRLDMVKGAYEHALSLAGKQGGRAPAPAAAAPAANPAASKAAMAATLVQNLKDMSRERRLAAARSLAKLGLEPKTFEALDQLVALPGFPDADGEEQQALLDALVASGGERSVKPLELLAQRTLGLPVCKLARNALEQAKKAKGGK